jgi:hypothetical protein
MDQIIEVFTAASTAAASTMPTLQKRLKKAMTDVDFNSILRSCVDRVLLASTKEEVSNRLITFFSGASEYI